jgi:hypothetical protein
VFQARRYLKELPTEVLPVAGSDGAKQRHRNLERQFPVHDVEPNQCHDLTDTELKRFVDFIQGCFTLGQPFVKALVEVFGRNATNIRHYD